MSVRSRYLATTLAVLAIGLGFGLSQGAPGQSAYSSQPRGTLASPPARPNSLRPGRF